VSELLAVLAFAAGLFVGAGIAAGGRAMTIRRVICRLFGHDWYDRAYGIARCRRCEALGPWPE
jgi:hypothetical protein